MLEIPAIKRLSAVVVVLSLAGCAGVPLAPLQAYQTSFEELRSASLLIYENAAPALATGAPATGGDHPVTLGPPVFDREKCGVVIAASPDLRARCLALGAATTYNQALLDLRSGKSTDESVENIGRALTSINLFVGLLPSATALPATALLGASIPALKGIFEEALKARDRVQLLKILTEGEPTLRRLITALRTDTDHLYVLQRNYTQVKLLRIQTQIDDRIYFMTTEVGLHSAPVDANVIRFYGAQQDQFDRIFASPEPKTKYRLSTLPFGSARGLKPLDVQAINAFDAPLVQAAVSVQDFKAVATQYGQSVEALKKYDAMINAWEQSLNGLMEASRNTFSAGGGTAQAVAGLVAIRERAREIKSILQPN